MLSITGFASFLIIARFIYSKQQQRRHCLIERAMFEIKKEDRHRLGGAIFEIEKKEEEKNNAPKNNAPEF